MERILVLEREPGLGKDLALEGYVVEVAADGVALCREVRRAGVETPILMVQGCADEAGLLREKELGRTFRLLLEEER